MLLRLCVSSLLCMMQAVGVAAAEVWSVPREGDGSCRLSRAPSAVPYAHTLAPLASHAFTHSMLNSRCPDADRSPLPPEAYCALSCSVHCPAVAIEDTPD